jgi:hypothetical protein
MYYTLKDINGAIKMPDGDIIHKSLPHRFLNFYAQLKVGSLVKEQLITKMNHQKPQEEEAWQTISWIPLIPKN